MAVDTRNRRASVLGFTLASTLVLPSPDAAISAADRQHLAYSYGLVADVLLATDVAILVRVDASTVTVRR